MTKTWRDALLVLLAGLVLALLVSAPYALGALKPAAGWEFTGFLIAAEDGNSYLSTMLQGAQGRWSFQIVYTTEPHQGALFFLFYLLLGKLARLFGLSPALALHLSRVVLIPLALYSFWRMAVYLCRRQAAARLATALLALAGGLGWLWVLLGGTTELERMPVDLWVPDASFFLSALTFPHLVLKQGLLFLFIVEALRFVERGGRRPALLAMLAGLGASLIHPYTLPVIGVPLGMFVLWRARRERRLLWSGIGRLALVAAPSLPYVAYSLWVFQTNPVFRSWQAQNTLYSPPPHLYLLGFGLLTPLALVGLLARQPEGRPHPFVAVWFVVIPLLLYVPYVMQRRFLDGYQAPLVILAAAGILYLLGRLRSRRLQNWVAAGLGLPLVLTNMLLLAGALATASQPQEPAYRPAWEMQAVRWFRGIPGYPTVMGSYLTGNLLPAQAPARAFVGHGPETMNSDAKIALAERFYDALSADEWRSSLLAQYGIDYVYHGPRERALGAFEPAQAPYLHLVYDNGIVQIYRVQEAAQ